MSTEPTTEEILKDILDEIKKIAKELKRYNDRQEKKDKMVESMWNEKDD
jgi:hypothetical protein